MPQAHVAVLDGTAHAPGQRGKQWIKTLWGKLAWQLGGADPIRSSKNRAGTSLEKMFLSSCCNAILDASY